MLYESQEVVIELFNYYSSVASEVKRKLKYGSCLKILISKQILQRLPIALAQFKAGSTSQILLQINSKSNQTNYILFLSRNRNY